MTDPVRRDPTYFLRTLKKMAQKSGWEKSFIFAAKARMIGYQLGIEHYNVMLFSQAMWGRVLEIVKIIRWMQEDRVRPNGATYYYICMGMANAEHGYAQDFPVNRRLPAYQHWRVALNALNACEKNGFDATDTMYNSVIVTCATPAIDKWDVALEVLERMKQLERKPHPTMIEFLHNCLVRCKRPKEASDLLRYAAECQVKGYEHAWEADVYSSKSPNEPVINLDEIPEYKKELATLYPRTGGVPPGAETVFRPRVFRALWYKWHAIANKYRPTETLRNRQLAPRHSPTGIPGFHRL